MGGESSEEISGLFGLHGRTAVVTGAGRGLGLEIARLLCRAGARTVLADVLADEVGRAADALNEGAAAEVALAVPTDVSREQPVVDLFARAVDRFGGVDAAINVAGVIGKTPFGEITAEGYDRYHAVNSRGVFLCMREALKHMRAAGRGGSIVNISSVGSLRATSFDNAAYGASKGSVNALTTAAALENGPYGIRVNAALPGAIQVERHRAEAAQGVTRPGGPLTDMRRVPLGRYGKPHELAAVVLFLASDAASYITGQLLAVDGGFLVG